MSTPIKATDRKALNEAFAVKVAGALAVDDGMMRLPDATMGGISFENWVEIPDWTDDTERVLPYLEKHGIADIRYDASLLMWVVDTGRYAAAPTFPLAAVIALLRANGVEVVP